MGSEQLSAVMAAVGKSVDPELKARIERESDVVFGSARLWDDGIIPPEGTRGVLAQGLKAAMANWDERAREEGGRFGIFRM